MISIEYVIFGLPSGGEEDSVLLFHVFTQLYQVGGPGYLSLWGTSHVHAEVLCAVVDSKVRVLLAV